MREFYRLDNDIVLRTFKGDRTLKSNQNIDVITKNGIDYTQLYPVNSYDIDIRTIHDFEPTSGGIIEYIGVKCEFYFRQYFTFERGTNAFQISLIGNCGANKNNPNVYQNSIINVVVLYNSILPIEPTTIDGSVFYGALELLLPESLLVNETLTIYDIKSINYDDNTPARYDNYITQNPLNLVHFEPLTKLDLDIGNVENYVELVNDYLEIGLISLDVNRTLEQTILDQIGVKNAVINVTHNIQYGYTDNMDLPFEDLVIFKEIALSNLSNQLVSVEYKPIFDNVYNPNTINKILFISIESIIDVGGIKFTRYTQNKYDFSSFFVINDRVDVMPVTVTHNIENVQTVIETKEVIKPVIINQFMGYNMADNNHQITYVTNAVIAFPEIENIEFPERYLINILNKKGEIIVSNFAKIDSQGILYFTISRTEDTLISDAIKAENRGGIINKNVEYQVVLLGILQNENDTIIRNGTVIK